MRQHDKQALIEYRIRKALERNISNTGIILKIVLCKAKGNIIFTYCILLHY
jgi:hypothetical protein